MQPNTHHNSTEPKMNQVAACLEKLLLDLLIDAIQQIRLQNLLTHTDNDERCLCYKERCPSRDPIPF